MEFARIEVRKIEDEELPPVILPKAGGHRRVYVYLESGVRYLINVMCIGDAVDGVTFGEIDAQLSVQEPQHYLRNLSSEFLRIAWQRWTDDPGASSVAFLVALQPNGSDCPHILRVYDRQHELTQRFGM